MTTSQAVPLPAPLTRSISGSPIALPAGRGCVRVVRADDRSVVTRAFATSPLRLLVPRNHGRAAWIYMSSYGGGLLDGDAIALDVDVRRGAAAFISTQASTKVYRSPVGTESTVDARVAPAALLVMAPDPVVCFAGARHRQRLRLDVAADGALVLVDALLAGRCAAGERWAFTAYESRLEVAVDGRLTLLDPVALRSEDGDVAARMGRFDALAVIAIFGAPLAREAARIVAAVARETVSRRPDQLLAAFPVGEHGCVVRIAGVSPEQVRQTVRRLLAFVPERLQDDPWARKW